MKKTEFEPSKQLISDLVEAGYDRGTVFECMLQLNERGEDYNNAAPLVKELMKRGEGEEKAAEKGEKKEHKEEDLCKICFVNVIDTVLLNCGHVAICMECSRSLQNCPICRDTISKVVKTFKS